jgi:hypothetical protein
MELGTPLYLGEHLVCLPELLARTKVVSSHGGSAEPSSRSPANGSLSHGRREPASPGTEMRSTGHP